MFLANESLYMLTSQIVTFGDFIRTKRKQKNLTQADLLRELVARGVKAYTDTVVTHWERNRAMPPINDPQFVQALADILGVTEAEILEAAGFNLDTGAPGELPEEIVALLKNLSPEQLDAVANMIAMLGNQQKDKPKS